MQFREGDVVRVTRGPDAGREPVVTSVDDNGVVRLIDEAREMAWKPWAHSATQPLTLIRRPVRAGDMLRGPNGNVWEANGATLRALEAGVVPKATHADGTPIASPRRPTGEGVAKWLPTKPMIPREAFQPVEWSAEGAIHSHPICLTRGQQDQDAQSVEAQSKVAGMTQMLLRGMDVVVAAEENHHVCLGGCGGSGHTAAEHAHDCPLILTLRAAGVAT